jgi:hypothetical protein
MSSFIVLASLALLKLGPFRGTPTNRRGRQLLAPRLIGPVRRDGLPGTSWQGVVASDASERLAIRVLVLRGGFVLVHEWPR